MIYSKECIAGRNIDLSKYNLGIIRQPSVDDLMDDLDIIDFLKPYYLIRSWDVNGVFKEKEIPFTFFLIFSSENAKILELLINGLKLLYETNEIELVNIGEDEYKMILKKNGEPFAFIDDSNFSYLSKVILEILYYDEPIAEKEDEYKGDKELIELVKQKEKEYEEKHKDKNTVSFEETVRRVIHMRKGTYEDIKNLTIWQLQDTYRSYLFMDNEKVNWQFASSGNFKVNKVNKWQDQTKTVRDAQK